jgi:hypothetical protein
MHSTYVNIVSPQKDNTCQLILMEASFSFIKISTTAHYLMRFNMVDNKPSTLNQIQGKPLCSPSRTPWQTTNRLGQVSLKVIPPAHDIFVETLFSEHPSYFLLQVSFTESCIFTDKKFFLLHDTCSSLSMFNL